MQKIITFRNDILKKIVISIIIVSAAGLLIKKPDIVKGFLLGASVSGILFFIKTKKIMKILEKNVYSLKGRTVFDFIIRYFLMFAALAVAYTNPGINFAAAVVGIFILQIVIMVNELILAKIYKKK